jgi:hypothetical protein
MEQCGGSLPVQPGRPAALADGRRPAPTPKPGVVVALRWKFRGSKDRAPDDLVDPAELSDGDDSKIEALLMDAALRRVANQRPAARMLELLDETDTDLSDEALRGAWRNGGRG